MDDDAQHVCGHPGAGWTNIGPHALISLDQQHSISVSVFRSAWQMCSRSTVAVTTDECCITRTPTSCLSVAVRRNPAIQNWPYQLHAVLLEQSLTVIKEGSLLMPLLSSGYVDGIAGVARSKAVLARPWQTAQERISVRLVRLLPANPAFCQNNSLGLLRRLAAGCWLHVLRRFGHSLH